MQQSFCDCPSHKDIIYLCLQQLCNYSRRMCADCQQLHRDHQKIYVNKQGQFKEFSLFEDKPQKRQVQNLTHATFNRVDPTIQKMNIDLKQILSKWSRQKDFFKQIFQTIMNITNERQQYQKIQKVKEPATTLQQLNLISRQLRHLKSGSVSKSYLIEYCDKLIDGYLKINKQTQIYFSRLNNIANKMHILNNLFFSLEKGWQQFEQLQQYQSQIIIKNKSKILQKKTKQENKLQQEQNSLNFNEEEQPQSKLDISDKNLQVIPKEIDMASDMLKQLILNNNCIKKIQFLDKYYGLKELYLNNNIIQKIQNLENLKLLKVLAIGQNKINKIQNLQFQNKLETLYLCSNSISKIQNLQHLSNLKILHLGKNQIEAIENVDKLINLQELCIYQNKITSINNCKLIPSLKILTISENQLSNRRQSLDLNGVEIQIFHQ